MQPESELGTFLRKHREALGWGLREAAGKIGITHSWLVNVERGQTYTEGRPFRPSREVLGKIATAYKLPERLLLMQAGYLEGEFIQLTQDEREVLTLFGALPPDRRKLALSMLRVFAAGEEAEDGQGVTWEPGH